MSPMNNGEQRCWVRLAPWIVIWCSLEQAPAARWTDHRSHSKDDDSSSSGSDGSDGSDGSGSGSRRRNNSWASH